MLICIDCNKEFTSKKGLKYHVENKVCKVTKIEINCLFCNKKYYNKNIFLKHLNKKHKKKINVNNIENKIEKNFNCKKSITNIYNELNNINKNNIDNLDNIMSKIKKNLNNLEENIYDSKIVKLTNSNKMITSNNFKCELCNKEFSRADSLKRHYKQFCKNRKEEKNTINVINTENNFNLITCVNINNFTKENLKSLSNDDILEIVNRCYTCIPKLFKKIHIDIPENRNLYLTSIKNQFLYAYQDNKWQLNDIKNILNIIKDQKMDIVENFIENNKEKFTTYKIKRLYQMIDDYKKGKLNKTYNNNLKLLMMNYKDTLKESYEKHK